MKASDRHIWLLVFGSVVISATLYVDASVDIDTRQLVPPAASLLDLIVVMLRTIQGTARDDVKLTIGGLFLVLLLLTVIFFPIRFMVTSVIGPATTHKGSPRRERTGQQRGEQRRR